MNNKLMPLVEFVLYNAHKFTWSLQGLGMLRLYLPNEARLHIWDKTFAYPNASPIHDHAQWALQSTIISGRLFNTRYIECVDGVSYNYAIFKAGFGTQQKTQQQQIKLQRQNNEEYGPGDTYSQNPAEIHETNSIRGTVTIMQKYPTIDGETARIFWPVGEEWGSAEPRQATFAEVEAITTNALELLLHQKGN